MGRFVIPKSQSSFNRKEYRKKYYSLHRLNGIQKAVEWGKQNKEKRKEAKDRWRAKNKDLTNFYTRRHNHLRKNALGSYSKKEAESLFDRFNGLCAYCKTAKATSIDHVVPLTKGGSNFIENLLPACIPCNSRKKDKLYA